MPKLRNPQARGNAWRPDIRAADGPVYSAIANALEADIAAGRLAPGARLPSQRALAQSLGVNLTTVMRAVREAERRGVVMGHAGSGTYVAPRLDPAPAHVSAEQRADFVDLSLNFPPDSAEEELAAALAGWAETIARRPQECRSLLPYRANAGSASDRAAGALWLEERGLTVDPGRIAITSGAQHGLVLSLATLARPGKTILCEALTYPGLRAAAVVTGLKLVPVEMDDDGLRPAALREAIGKHSPVALVTMPTLHNPTGIVTSLGRRQELARVLRKAELWVIEDDVYGALAEGAPKTLAALLPERTMYVTSLSKTVAPGLRVGYVTAPNPQLFEGLVAALRESSWMTAPIVAGIAAAWIREGVAQRAVKLVRADLARRWKVVKQALPSLVSESDPRSPHLWIPLPNPAREARVVAELHQRGVGVSAGEAFRVGGAVAPGFRICLGAPRTIESLTGALRTINEVLEQRDPPRGRMVL